MKSSSSQWIAKLRRILKPSEISTKAATLKVHASDAWMASAMPDVVVLPKNTESVSKIMRFASIHGIPVTARGAGKGYVGGCVPRKGGIVLSLARMNRILEINPLDGVAVTQPGVITKQLQDAVRKEGWFYPPDPASLKDSFIGGNVATNAGGPRCLKYGVTRNYILGLEVVLADGSVVNVGGRTMKNKVGFDFVGLFTGSEGVLGVITKITVRLIPHPPTRAALAVTFSTPELAARAVQEIFRARVLPCALEVADAFTLRAARKALGNEVPGGKACVIVEVDGQPGAVRAEWNLVTRVLKRLKPVTMKRAFGDKACEQLWSLRRQFSSTLKSTGLTKLNEDIVVPRSRLVDLFRFTGQLQKKHGIQIASFGHAGDGNIHVNLMIEPGNKLQRQAANKALDALFKKVTQWSGVMSGEHGVGIAKERWWYDLTAPEFRRLHQAVKTALDPKGILNPDKCLSDQLRAK